MIRGATGDGASTTVTLPSWLLAGCRTIDYDVDACVHAGDDVGQPECQALLRDTGGDAQAVRIDRSAERVSEQRQLDRMRLHDHHRQSLRLDGQQDGGNQAGEWRLPA